MNIKYMRGDAIELAKQEGHFMIHCCNNKGGFGGGKYALATQVKESFPSAYTNYLAHHNLGDITADDDVNVLNLVAQDGYGARWKGVKYFKEEAFEMCLNKIIKASTLRDLRSIRGLHTVVVPAMIGSDRAGGDKATNLEMVEKYLSPYFDLVIVEWEGE